MRIALHTASSGLTFDQYAKRVSQVVSRENRLSYEQVKAVLIEEGLHLCFPVNKEHKKK